MSDLMQRVSLKTRLIVVVSLLLILGFVLTNLNNYRTSSRSLHQSIVDHALPLTRDNIYSEIQADLMRPVYISSLMANDTFLKDWALSGEKDVPKVTRYLQEIKQKYGFFSAFFVSETNGRYYHSGGILKQLSRQDAHDDWYYRFTDLNKPYDLEVDTNEAADNRLTIFINHRLTDFDGRLLGVTGVGLNMEVVSRLLKTYRDRYGREVYLVDREGLIKVHNDQGMVDQVNISDLDGLASVARQVLAAQSKTDVYEFRRQDRHILLTSRYIPEFDWFLLVEQDETRTLAGLRANLYKNLGFDLVIIMSVLLMTIWTVNRFQSRIEEMAIIDKLTGACNRREFDRRFEAAVSLQSRQGTPFSVILFDIDNFKAVNDTFGHVAGDHVLKEVAALAAVHIRKHDLLVRWGGDEFAVLLQGELPLASQVAERLREEISELDLLAPFAGEPRRQRVTISCGVVTCHDGESLDHVMMRVDRALYESKHGGKNRTVAVSLSVPDTA